MLRLRSLLWLLALAPAACADRDPLTDDAGAPATTTTAAAAQRAQGWRLSFYDEFNGVGTSGFRGAGGLAAYAPSCWDPAQHPVRCSWERGKSDPCNATPLRGPGGIEPALDLSHLAKLNKCVWTVYDQFSYWGAAVARFQPDRVGFIERPAQSGNFVLALETKLGGSTADPGTDACGASIATPWPHTGRGCPITSGAVNSRRHFDGAGAVTIDGAIQRYGRFEIRAKLPSGRGAFPAHWMQSNSGGWIESTCGHRHYGEIDIMEWTPWRPGRTIGSQHHGHDRPDQCGLTGGHDGARSASFSTDHDPGDARFTSDFHVYAVEWEAGEVRIEVDGLRYARYVQGQPVEAWDSVAQQYVTIGAELADEPMFLLLNTSLDASGGFDPGNLAGFTTMTHELDYVRYYERCDLSPSDPDCQAAAPRSGIITDDAGLSGSHRYDSAYDQRTGPALWSSALRRLHVLDVDGDGLDDVLLRNRAAADHSSYLLRARPDGSFAQHQVVDGLWGMSRALWADDARELVAGDWNGDGCDDVLLRGRTVNDASYLLRADCAGGFAAVQLVDTAAGMTRAAWSAATAAIVTGDWNGDGRTDLLLPARTTTGATYALYGQVSGGFATRADVSIAAGMTAALWSDALRRAVVGDFDGDGKDDVLLQNRATAGHSSYLLRGATTGFVYRQVIDTAVGLSRVAWADDLRLAHVGDLDGDGKDDVLLQNRSAAEPGYLVRGGTGGFASSQAFTLIGDRAALANSRHLAALGDFTGDGRADLLLQPRPGAPILPSTDDRAWLVPGLASGTFGAPTDVTDQQAMSAPLWSTRHHALAIGRFAAHGALGWLLQADGTANTDLTRVDGNGVAAPCSGNPAAGEFCEFHDTYLLYR